MKNQGQNQTISFPICISDDDDEDDDISRFRVPPHF